jgi:molybdate transport system substrate-binding protein
MRKRNTCSLLLIVVLLLTSSISQAFDLHISAATSLSNSVNELSGLFKKTHTGVKILPNFASSGSLAKQINQGAPTDIYISANPKWMDFLIEQGKVEKNSRKTLIHNRLVFVGRNKAYEMSMNNLENLERIAIGSPNFVPAGQYAKQAMTQVGVYQKLITEGKLVMAKDVRQALIYADRGETDGAFVYNSDARLAKHVVVLFTVPQELHDQVTYPIALTVSGKDNSVARAYYDFLFSPGATRIFSKNGFTPVEGN